MVFREWKKITFNWSSLFTHTRTFETMTIPKHWRPLSGVSEDGSTTKTGCSPRRATLHLQTVFQLHHFPSCSSLNAVKTFITTWRGWICRCRSAAFLRLRLPPIDSLNCFFFCCCCCFDFISRGAKSADAPKTLIQVLILARLATPLCILSVPQAITGDLQMTDSSPKHRRYWWHVIVSPLFFSYYFYDMCIWQNNFEHFHQDETAAFAYWAGWRIATWQTGNSTLLKWNEENYYSKWMKHIFLRIKDRKLWKMIRINDIIIKKMCLTSIKTM